MSPRYAVLRPDWLLRGYSDRAGVLANWRTAETRPLAPAGTYVARACDGHTDLTSPAFLPKHLATLDLMLAQGLAEECACGAELDPRQRFRAASNRYIQYAQWAITGRCNLRCRHCYMDGPTARYGELSTETLLGFVDQFAEANVQRLHLTGGEPLLHPGFWDLAGALTEQRIAIHQISTNGVLLDDEALRRLRDLEAHPILHFSLDGIGTHDFMRGHAGAEEAALSAIRRAADAGFRVSVTSCLDSVTRDGMLPALEVMADAGVTSWHVTAPYTIGCWTTTSTALSLDEQAAACEPLLRRWLELDRPLLMTLCGMYTAAPGEYVPPQEPLHRCSPDDLHCGALLDDTAYVMPNGQLNPCPRFVGTPFETLMPSLLDVRLSEAWADEGLRSRLGVTKADVLARNPDCADCDEFGECGAGCWATAYAATGDVLGRDPEACVLWRSPHRRRFAAIAEHTT